MITTHSYSTCRNVVGLKGANSKEVDENTDHPVIIYMPEVSKNGERRSYADNHNKWFFASLSAL